MSARYSKAEIQEQIIQLSKELENFLTKVKDNKYSVDLEAFTGTVFVVFNSPEDKTHYEKNLSKNGFLFLVQYILSAFKSKIKFNIYDLVISPAPEPTDVNWINLEYTEGQQMIRTLIIYFISFLVLGLSLGALTAISYLQRSIKHSGLMRYLVSTVFSLVVSTFNWAISKTLIVITE